MFLVERLALGAKASDVTKAVRRIRDDERMIIVSCDVVFVSVLIQRLVADDVSCAAVVVASSLCEVYGMMVWLLLHLPQQESMSTILIPPSETKEFNIFCVSCASSFWFDSKLP